LLVTPEGNSPCVVGTWNPAIVLPESVMTDASAEQLRHVLAHELAHLARGDLWTNWLMLTARVLHWFNPVVWWAFREMLAEREAACDELALIALGESDRSAYAATIVELAASLAVSAIAPGFIELFSSKRRLTARVERLLRYPSITTLRAPIAAGLLLATGLIGLTDAMPGARAQPPRKSGQGDKEEPKGKTYTLGGNCVDHADGTPLPGVSVRLYRVEGRTAAAVEVATMVTGADGRFEFTGLVPPRLESHLDYLEYAVFGFAGGRPVGNRFIHFDDKEEVSTIRMVRQRATLSGKVVDSSGRSVAGATVLLNTHTAAGKPVPGLPATRTDSSGRFKLDDVGVYKAPDGSLWVGDCAVLHPDYPETTSKLSTLPADIVVTLPAGCVVTGTVVDRITGNAAAGALILARRVDEWGESFVAADAAGRFRFVLQEGRYDFLAEARDRIGIGVSGRECLAGEKVETQPLELTGGGFIAGQVVNTASGQTVTIGENGEPVAIAAFGPSLPAGRVISPTPPAAVDQAGRFVLRAAPGENFPYFLNTHGSRMSWDTQEQPAVIVKEGETTTCNMLITPPVPLEEKVRAARKLVATLSKKPVDRTAQIILEFGKLSRTVDEEELWCRLMRELVAVGRDAVPQLCDELDRTTEDRSLRRLGFALRAIGDPRAVPALIRAVPRTLLKGGSDYGLTVDDKDLMDFMETHDLREGKNEQYFDLGRAVREITGALHRLTGQDFDGGELCSFSLSEDPRRQVMQRRIYARGAQRWQAWWEKNWRTFTDDPAYQMVGLKLADEPLPPAIEALSKTARLRGEVAGAVLSPASENAPYSSHCYDLDTGCQPNWPARIPRDETILTSQLLEDWASLSGVDLMCVTHRAPDGTETYVLKSLGMKVREISTRDLRNLDRLIAAGTLPEGRPVGEMLMHYDNKREQLVPDANAAFLFVTREGSMGLIETTDRITRIGGAAGSHKGVRFNLSAIIP
jgi:hypothetical protein